MNAPKVAGYATGDETPFVITFVGRISESEIFLSDYILGGLESERNCHEASRLSRLPFERFRRLVPFTLDARPFAPPLAAGPLAGARLENRQRPSGSAGSGWNECRGSAGRVEKRVRSINQPPPW